MQAGTYYTKPFSHRSSLVNMLNLSEKRHW